MEKNPDGHNPTIAAWKIVLGNWNQDDITLTVAAMTRLPHACCVSVSCTSLAASAPRLHHFLSWICGSSPVGDELLLQVMGEYEAVRSNWY